MKILEVVSEGAIFAVTLAAAVYTFPTGNSNTAEFFMKASTYDQINWNETDPNLDRVRQNSESSFGENVNICPSTVKTGTNLSVNEKSTCPWFYRRSHDPARYPSDILYAHTPCTHCIGSDGNLQCHPVKRTIQVLAQKEEVSGEIRYEPEDIVISVGFTCGSPNFVDTASQTAAWFTSDNIQWARRR